MEIFAFVNVVRSMVEFYRTISQTHGTKAVILYADDITALIREHILGGKTAVTVLGAQILEIPHLRTTLPVGFLTHMFMARIYGDFINQEEKGI